jgi:hypothetical protein
MSIIIFLNKKRTKVKKRAVRKVKHQKRQATAQERRVLVKMPRMMKQNKNKVPMTRKMVRKRLLALLQARKKPFLLQMLLILRLRARTSPRHILKSSARELENSHAVFR